MVSVGIGLAGFGTVGAGVFRALKQNGDLLAQRTGTHFEIRRIALRDPTKSRPLPAPLEIVTTRWQDLMTDPKISIIVELMGGTVEPLALLRSAFAARKLVVTGNKALLAEHGAEIFELSRSANMPVFYEAAVAGGVPIIKSIREAFIGNRFESIYGILNGTSNYILSRMTESEMDFHQALREAQSRGFAEADPSLDLNGWDAAHKTILLASLAHGFWVGTCDIKVEGIETFSNLDIRFARQLGYRIKLLSSIRSHPDREIEISVGPVLIPASHILASVNGVFNAILVRGDMVGESLFYGRGAGESPTASAVLGNLAEAALSLSSPTYGSPGPHNLYGRIKNPDSCLAPFYLRLVVNSQPKVLTQIASILGDAKIGIMSLVQSGGQDGHQISLVLMLQKAVVGVTRKAIRQIAVLPCVREKPVLLRVEHFV
ncbi:Homoserine dehydrogenase [Candidatus Xiphinematobacter sp. Idaho Grape]|uniref:homoserine dehydrogenase n=1 Tax=Candidatus Xiphinematobacter sp. Idaho Grape TaxID=1704307 RepID=UPI0007059F42|nr:homoserine dehydrogenase [Candidatus Xiphinematobacter sp. Idaho Grape]ALJ56463.1 Homoserine dehydrogenase [Candidatus Xiphinematobacter sp. Idaho Grape]